MSIEDVKSQGIGAYIAYLKELNFNKLQAALQNILNNEKNGFTLEEEKLIQVLIHVNEVRDFISKPRNILGNDATKHGEIAEKFDVLQRNCLNILEGLKADATFMDVGRLAPEDYIVDGQAVQSKFLNGLNETLKAVLEHNNKYEYFGADGKSFYVIPKDQFEVIKKTLDGNKMVELDGQPLRLSTIQKTKELVDLIESRTNRSFFDVTKPSQFKYAEVQLGKANQTLENRERQYLDISNEKKNSIIEKAKVEKNVAIIQAKPSFMAATKIAGIASILGGGIALAISVYNKTKSGVKLENFTLQDWKDVGFDAGEGALKGGVTGYSVYFMTNFLKTPAPLASAYTSAAFGIANIANMLRKGEIDFEEFIEMSQIVSLDSAFNALGATIGQSLIPIPILGAIVGSLSINIVSSISKDYLNAYEIGLIDRYQVEYNRKIEELDETNNSLLKEIIRKYEASRDLSELVFDFNVNNDLRLQASISLAKDYGVAESNTLKNCLDVDQYFIN